MPRWPRNDPRQYDDLVSEWWRPAGPLAALHWLAAARARLVPPAGRPGAVLVDVGCGGGLLAEHLDGRGYRHIGVDLVRSALGQAAAHGVRPVVADAGALPFADGCADVVVAGEVFEHVTDLPGVVAEVCRVLRPGGLLVLDTLNATALSRLLTVTLAERFGTVPKGIHDPALYVDPDRLTALCAAHGVRLRVRGVRPTLAGVARWLLTGRGTARIVPTFSTAVLYQGQGRKRGTAGRPARATDGPGGGRGGGADGGPGGAKRSVGGAPAGGRPVIAGIGVALPAQAHQEQLWDGFYATHYAGPAHPLARRIFANAGVRTRQAVVNPLLEDASGWSTERRMRRYLTEALPLGKEAIERALAAAGCSAGDIGLFVVCSCTGYVTPGLDILLARDLSMAVDTQRLFVGHMGCYAALPGLGAASDFVAARGRPALLLCAELTSLHTQPPTVDTQQIVAHALFSDATAAAVVAPAGRPGYALRGIAAATDAATADHMTWDVTDLGFRMGLSPRVPQVLSTHVRPLVDGLLARHGLTAADVDGWAVHPGGPRILAVVRRELALPAEALEPSLDVLARFGNCSSPTVLLVLDQLARRPDPPRRVVMLAFGPGLTLYGVLLERGLTVRRAGPGRCGNPRPTS